MTLEQLRIFIAVAEREHMTRAAEALHVTQSAASGAIAALEAQHDVKLFHRVGRRIELTGAGRMFLDEARAVVARAASARQALDDYGSLKRGTLCIVASQTIAAYWLPERLAAFRRRHPDVDLAVTIANTQDAASTVRDGAAELGFIEGEIDDPALAQWEVGADRMLLVGGSAVAAVTNDWLLGALWVLREAGSGTRSTFERAVRDRGIDPARLNVALTLPSNEAVLAAVLADAGFTVLSQWVAGPAVAARMLRVLPFDLPSRSFFALRHKERYRSKAADALIELLGDYGAQPDYVI